MTSTTFVGCFLSLYPPPQVVHHTSRLMEFASADKQYRPSCVACILISELPDHLQRPRTSPYEVHHLLAQIATTSNIRNDNDKIVINKPVNECRLE